METGYIFTTLIIGTGIFHLIYQAASYLGKLRDSATDSARNNMKKKHNYKRKDWYLFFHTNNLLGQTESSTSTSARPRTSTNGTSKKRPASRPTIHMH